MKEKTIELGKVRQGERFKLYRRRRATYDAG